MSDLDEPSGWVERLLVWSYALLLHLSPKAHRERHGAEMRDWFLHLLRERRANGGWAAAVGYVGRATVDLVTTGVRLRRDRGPRWSERLVSDLRSGGRFMLLKPLWTAVIVLALALPMAANTAIFAVLDSTLLDPLPYGDPDQLVMLWSRLDGIGLEKGRLAGPELAELAERAQRLESFGGIWARFGTLGGENEPEHIDIGWVTGGFFETLEVPAIAGRYIEPLDDVPGVEGVILLSHALWQRRFGGDTGVVGRVVQFNGEAVTVIGVMPEEFGMLLPEDARLPQQVDAWLPWADDYSQMPRELGWRMFATVGRMANGADVAQTNADLNRIAAELVTEVGDYDETGLAFEVEPLHAGFVAAIRPGLIALLGAALLVLLVACTNVASLLTVRTNDRAQEMAVRSALGADRARLVLQIVTEHALLFVLGGFFGLLLSVPALQLLRALKPADIRFVSPPALEPGVLGFTFGIIALAGLVFGSIPALRVRLDLQHSTMRRVTAGGGARRARESLVAVQVALCMVLLVGAGLMARSFVALQAVERGFEPAGVLTARLSLPGPRYDYGDPAPISGFYEELLRRVESIPGVSAAGLTEQIPLSGGTSSREAYSYMTAEGEVEWGTVAADTRSVSKDYFDTIDATLVSGRFFTTEDQLSGRNVVIVDDRLAQRAWPGQDPLGKQIRASVFIRGETVPIWSEVVGVVRHVRLVPLSAEGGEQIYLHHIQSPRRSLSLAVRTNGDPRGLAPAIRAEVFAMDPQQPVFDVRPLVAYVDDSVGQVRFILSLIGIFAGLAVVLAVVGVHGLLSYVVAGARREIGIRVALGAGPSDIVPRFLRRGATLVAVGIGVGLAGASIASGALSTVVYGVAVRDPATMAASAAVLATAAALACYLPVRRALRVDPAEILAEE